MKKSVTILFVSLMLSMGLLFSPVYTVSAAEEGDTHGEAEAGTPAGAGPIVLLIGLGAVGLVGFMYASRQGTIGTPEN